MFHMVADHAVRPEESDIIFGLAARAGEAAKIYGEDKIINSTMGVLCEDDGTLVAFKSVYEILRNLPDTMFARYSDLAGDPAFLESVVSACFMDKKPSGFVQAIATPGATGALRNAIANYTEEGDTFITSNWYWAPYLTIAQENNRKLDLFNLFDEDGNFDFESYKAVFEKHLAKQKRLVCLFNNPAHNPTGYSLSSDEWDKVIALARSYAADPENRIVFLLDVAYIDFSGDDSRDFFLKFGGLEENIITLVAFSASKSYTMYGLRNGALICVTPNEDLAKEFYYSCAFSNRGTWSNGTRCAMQVVTEIFNNDDLFKTVESERNHYRALLKVRGDAFLASAAREGIPITTYRGGFFVSVPTSDPSALCEKLIERNLFTVPLQNGIRLAICATSEEKSALMPSIIAETLKDLN